MRSTPKPSQIRRKLFTAGVLALLMGLAGVLILAVRPIAVLSERAVSTPSEATRPPDRATIEAYARIKLPPNAADIQAYTETGIDSLILLKFSLPPSDVPEFLAASGFQKGLVEGYNPLQAQEPDRSAPWWQPQTAKLFAGTAAEKPGQFAQHILVDRTNPVRSIVYVEAFSM